MAKSNCADCAIQIKRLAAKPFYETRGREGLIELANTLHRYGHDKCAAVIDEALILRWGVDGADSVPSPADLRDLCRRDPKDFESAPLQNKKSANPDCKACKGTGWQEEQYRIQTGVFKGEIRTRMRRCEDGCVPPQFDPSQMPSSVGGRTSQMSKAKAGSV